MKHRYPLFAALLTLLLVLAASAAAAPPTDVSIDSHPSDPSSNHTPSFTFSTTDPTVTGFECRVDSDPFNTCSSGESFGPLSDGDHTFDVKAINGDGEATDSFGPWTIFTPDTNPPQTTITNGPNDPTTSTSAIFDYSSDEAGSTFECELDGGGFSGCPSSGKSYSGLNVGNHTFKVQATDPAGNTDPTPASYPWTIAPPPDTNPPNTTITSGPSGTTLSASAHFEYSSDEANSTFECRHDGGSFSSCPASGTTFTVGDGNHSFDVRAIDAAGNVDATPASRNWTVDTTGPTVSIGTKPSNPSSDTTPTFTFSSEAGATFHCELDGVPDDPCSSGVTYGPLSDGDHTFTVFATDAAGNAGNTATHNWRIGRPPVNVTLPAINAPTGLKQGETITAQQGTWDGTLPMTRVFKWFHCNPGGSGCQQVATGTSYVLGANDVDLVMKLTETATNEAGNASASSSLSLVVVDATAPDILLARKPAALTNRVLARFVFSSTDTRATFQCKLDSGVLAACASPREYTVRAGRHVFTLQATDRSHQTVSLQHTWTVDRTPPTAPRAFALRPGDRLVVASWGLPSVADLAFVRIVRYASPGVVVYRGRKTVFRDRRVRNRTRYVYVIRAFDKAGNHSKGITRVVRPRDPLYFPREGSRISTSNPPLIRWRPDAAAAIYNLQLRRWTSGHWRKILSVFPTRAQYQLPRHWRYKGRRQRFGPGLYVVHAWPWYGTRYGRLIGFNTFRGV